MDVLTDWVQTLKTHVVVLARSRMPAPWGFRVTSAEQVVFHIISEGEGWLRRDGAEPLRLLQGDLVLLAQGGDHDLVDQPDGAAEPLASFIERQWPQECSNPRTTVICGAYCSDIYLMQPFLRTLPPIVHFAARQVRSSAALSHILSLITAELDQTQPGSDALVQHLFDALFIYVVREWLTSMPAQQPSWLAALKDPALSKVLTHMHAAPQRPWTVESLAAESGLSRAAFARRFAQSVGEPPLAYLTRWRMGIASRMLVESAASLAEVAARVGYESEFTFSRAFKRSCGVAPSVFRRQASSTAGP